MPVEVLLLKDVRKLGHLGDVVKVRPGYARNYLIPYRLATAPTEENIAAIEEDRKRAAAERAQRNREFQALVERLGEASVTIEAAANPEGTLYGSVGAREIAEALQEQGFEVLPDHVLLDAPIRMIDNVTVTLEFTDEIATQVKVWVVREGGQLSDGDEAEPEPESAAAEPADVAAPEPDED
jgi:large subunit ribosomal protein L9